MFDHPCVVIIGAGASCDFGLPTGLSLYGQVLADCERCEALYRKSDVFPGREYQSLQLHEDFLRAPAPYVVNCMSKEGRVGQEYGPALRQHVCSVVALKDALNRSTAETIDEFLTLNPSYDDLCKILVATRFLPMLYAFSNNSFHVRPFWQRSAQQGRNWIHLFINAFRTNYLRGRRPKGTIHIISFNYDPIFRRVMDEVFEGSEQSIGPWSEHFELHQPYGSFSLPSDVTNIWTLVKEWASSMRTVSPSFDAAGNACQDDKLREIVRRASVVHAAGFNFARDNCALIGLTEGTDREIWYVNHDANPGLDDRVARYAGNGTKPFVDGQSEERRMSIARATALGLFGELSA
jgi:hypothetical protein